MSFSTWHVDYESLSGLCSTDLILRFDFLDYRKNDCTHFKIENVSICRTFKSGTVRANFMSTPHKLEPF